MESSDISELLKFVFSTARRFPALGFHVKSSLPPEMRNYVCPPQAFSVAQMA